VTGLRAKSVSLALFIGLMSSLKRLDEVVVPSLPAECMGEPDSRKALSLPLPDGHQARRALPNTSQSFRIWFWPSVNSHLENSFWPFTEVVREIQREVTRKK